LIVAAFLFDSLDGFLARLLKVNSKIGSQLDSFSDTISFCVVPGIFNFYFIKNNISIEYSLVAYIGFLTTVLGILRLSLFQTTSENRYFIGLPTPSLTLFILGLNYLPISVGFYGKLFLIVIFSFLMVTKIKFLNFRDIRTNKLKKIYLLSSLAVFLFFGNSSISLIIIIYTIVSLLNKKIKL
jgi:CDP-diacylglycerol--serine O-phosphatidyltransferase